MRADYALAMQLYDGGRIAAAAAELRPLAESGHCGAQVALAGLYADADLDVADRWAKAAELYRRAADRGSAVAQMNLGELLAEGRPGVRRNTAEAWMWLALAARQGRAWAAERRARLAAALSDRDIDNARRATRVKARGLPGPCSSAGAGD